MTDITAILEAHGGVASRADCSRIGIGTSAISRLIDTGRIIRVRRDAFVDGARWSIAAPWERHDLRARAVLRDLAPAGSHALSHHSSLAVQGIALYGVDDLVHVVGLAGQRDRRADILRVHTAVPAAMTRQSVTTHDGVLVCRPASSCVQLASYTGDLAALVSADDALRTGVMSAGDLTMAVESYRGFRGRRRVAELGLWANPRHESPGETRCAALFRLLGLPEPERQAEIRDERGALVGRVDFLFRSRRTIVEFDGMIKYGTRESLVAEKRREDRLRSCGFEVVRLVWQELDKPALVYRTLQAAFARSQTPLESPRPRVSALGEGSW